MPGEALSASIDHHRIDAIFRELAQSQLPGAAVGIALHGQPVYRQGFGLASVELPAMLSPTMRLRIGSTSKHFACLAYLLLCEQGRAGLDDPIGTYLPELHPVSRAVTLRQLMGNTSGLRDVHDISWQFSGRGQPVSSEELLALYCDIDDANAPPDSTWIYCNGGFLLLSVAIERITGQTLEQVLRERIFAPVGMQDTLLRRWDTDFVPNSATLHTSKLGGGFERWYLGSALAGEGGIVSTVDDMLRWLAHFDAPRVGTAATWELMKRPVRLSNGTCTGYGMGLFTTQYRGMETLYHPGGVMGGNAQMLKAPSAGLDVVVMVNRHDVSAVQLVEKVLDACLPVLAPIEPLTAAPLVGGVFQSPATGRVIQLLVNGGQQIASIDGVDLAVQADRDGALRPSGTSRYLKQSIRLRGEAGRWTSLLLEYFGGVDELYAASPVPSDVPSVLLDVLGRYRSPATHTELLVYADGGVLRLRSTGEFGCFVYDLVPLAQDVWRALSRHPTPRDGVYCFDRDTATVRFSNDRLRGLAFQRIA